MIANFRSKFDSRWTLYICIYICSLTLSCIGLAETFAQTLAEHGIHATRLPCELDLESATWVGPPLDKFFHMVNSNAELAKPLLRASNIWYVRGQWYVRE